MKTCTSKPSDDRGSIARKFCMPSWKYLYEQNKNEIGENPDLLKAESKLKIPQISRNKFLIAILCVAFVWLAEASDQNPKAIVLWENQVWSKNFVLRINQQRDSCENINYTIMIHKTDGQMDEITLKIDSTKNSESKYITDFRNKELYIISENGCAKIEMYALPKCKENITNGSLCISSINCKNDIWLGGYIADKMHIKDTGKYHCYPMSEGVVSGMCVFKPWFFKAYKKENDNYEAVASLNYIFLHGESIRIMYNGTTKKMMVQK